ncbi:MAG: flavodoxin family protein [Cupriavidus sp.]|nr:flavodoxin family protein [Cupriavidus sp.]
MYNIAVVFYSRTGTTREAAQMLADRLDCPIFEIADTVSRSGLWGDVRCVLDNVLRRHVPYRYTGPALTDCEKLVVMAPVWVGHLAAPMRSFLKDHRTFQGGLAAVAIMASRGGFRAAEEIAMTVGRPPHPALVLLQRDIASGEALQDINDFAASLLEQAPANPTQAPRAAWLSPNEA